MSEPENHTLVLLREMRAEINARFDRVEQRLDGVEKRLDSMHANGVKALQGFVGHRNIWERTMGTVGDDIADLKRRVERLEAARA
jgi:tetrahydromethanopterin S-methyltransferase subunit G